jgi:hypothetical protein
MEVVPVTGLKIQLPKDLECSQVLAVFQVHDPDTWNLQHIVLGINHLRSDHGQHRCGWWTPTMNGSGFMAWIGKSSKQNSSRSLF